MHLPRITCVLSLLLMAACGGDDASMPPPAGCPAARPGGEACTMRGMTCPYEVGFCVARPTLARFQATCTRDADGALSWREIETPCLSVDGGLDASVGDDAGVVDGAAGDDAGGGVDGGGADAGSVDAGSVDAGPVDAGSVDAGPVDAGSVDAGPVDAGSGLATGTPGCTGDADCASGVCWDFATYDPLCGGTVCSASCAVDADCAAAAATAGAATPDLATCGTDHRCDFVGTGVGSFFCA